MIEVDCAELSNDEKLALASKISDRLEGRALALVKLDSIVLDQLTDENIGIETVGPIVSDFISRRQDSEYYSFDVHGQKIIIHSTNPTPPSNRREENTLPPNLKQCPYCSFITQYEEEYTVHLRSHLFGV